MLPPLPNNCRKAGNAMLLVNKKREIKEAALEAVTKGGLSIREAAKKFGINRGVVQRLASGLTTPDSVVGRPTFLPKEVEDILAQKLLLAAERAFSVPLNLLPFIAKDIAKTLKLNVDSWTAGDKWLNGFLRRHPTLSVRKAGRINRARSLGFNSITHAEWYAMLEKIEKLFKPSEKFNVDDTGLDLEKGGFRVRGAHAALVCRFCTSHSIITHPNIHPLH